MKKANSEFFKRYYDTLHVLKPFTFAVYFPDSVKREGDLFEVGTKAILNFSTSSYELGTYVYNGLLELQEFPLFDNSLKLDRINLRRTLTLNQETVIFKTLAPVLVNNKGSANWYLLPDQEGFNEGLEFSVKETARTFLGDNDFHIDFKPIHIQRKVIRHYNMDRQGFAGVFELHGHPDVLNLIYQIGLGVRRSQGFGMLEVVP